jgi:elongator complex protein 3
LADLDMLRRKIAKEFKISTPSNVELLKAYHKLVKNKSIKPNKNLEIFLRKRKIRSLSGIVNISVLTKPYPCPGKCIYCPSQRGIPKSYLKKEPAVQRAILTNFEPCLQVQTRLKSLKKTGHPIDKIELRIIGGTWSYYPKNYQTWFIKECFRACNDFPKNRKEGDPISFRKRKASLLKLQKENEKAKQRLVGITIETRPDFINESEIKRMRKLGITRVELGVQSIYNNVLKLNKRGHKVEATIKATKLLKNAGFKVSYQIMPNLPGSDFKRDIKMFKEIFSNSDFQPDLLKIYPLALVKESPLYKWYLRGKFKPYSKKKLIKLLVEIKKQIPYYCRIQRIIRDIPSEDVIEGGVKISNLREVVQKEMKKQGSKCKCIRCREVKENYNPREKLYLFRQDYDASDGKEIFLSYESKNQEQLYSLLRLRIPSQIFKEEKHFLPVLQNSAIIREVHTYGQLHPLGKLIRGRASVSSPQHKGMGKKLIKEAEKIAKKEFNIKKMTVISGIGVRDYFSKLKYRLRNTYMVKQI